MIVFRGFIEDFLTGNIYPVVRFPRQIIEVEGMTEHIYYEEE